MITQTQAASAYRSNGNALGAGRGASAPAARFLQTLSSVMQSPQSGQVSEEELFAALLQERVAAAGGDAGAGAFQDALSRFMAANRRSDGSIPLERSANQALRDLVAQGLLSEAQAAQAKREAFGAAQLDANTRKLFDGRGGAGDSAVADLASAIASALSRLAVLGQTYNAAATGAGATAGNMIGATPGGGFAGFSYPAGYQIPTASLASGGTGSGAFSDGFGAAGGPPSYSHGMRWNPHSTGIGKLAITLPYELQAVESCSVVDMTGNLVEMGSNSGIDKGRQVYRFARPGEEYPSPCYLEATMQDGSRHRFLIPKAGELHTEVSSKTSWS